jgi:hypothetical protein
MRFLSFDHPDTLFKHTNCVAPQCVRIFSVYYVNIVA